MMEQAFKRRMLLLGTVAASGLVIRSAQADQLADIMQSKKLRVATDLAIPPSGMMDGQMRATGSDVEVAQLLARDWGLELEFIQTTGATRIPNVQTGKADIIISTLSVTPERAKVVQFSKPYAALQSVVAGPKSVTLGGLEALKGRTVTVTRGTTQDSELTGLSRQHDFRVVRYDDDATMVTAATSGQAELIATSATLVSQVKLRDPARGFEPKFTLRNFDLAMGLRQNEPALLDKVNTWIEANIANGKLNAIYKKFHGVDLPEVMRGTS